ncbi:hypothetical protein Tco_0839844 [Tanacetum coccineum]|uniref:Uncharacterized protein n=1 Tax=Tanacetum coccineum TaxID=301880 RepID=A0ABQ5AUW8_9ASTR
MDEIETINIELEHSVAKLLSENERLHKEIEHLKKIYKDQFDSIKKTRALSKEHCDSLIAQLNSKSMENADLKGQIAAGEREIFLSDNNISTTIELKNLKGKNVLDNAATITNATTIAPGMFKLDLDPLAPSVSFRERLKSSTSASRSQPTGNKKNDRILQTPSSNMKNKVEVQRIPQKKAFRIYNKRTRKIMETIHVTFDELTAMASEQFNSGLELQSITPATSSSGLVSNPVPQQPERARPPTRND